MVHISWLLNPETMRSIPILLMAILCAVLACNKPDVPTMNTSTPETYLQSLDSMLTKMVASELADFKPDLLQAEQDSLIVMRASLDRLKQIDVKRLDGSATRLRQLDETHHHIMGAIGKTYALRNTVQQTDFIRSYAPEKTNQLDARYHELIKLASANQLEKAKALNTELEKEYQQLIHDSKRKLKEQYASILQDQKNAVEHDLQTLETLGDPNHDPEEADQVVYRLNLGQQAWNNNRLDNLGDLAEPPYFPPLPPQPGPNPPSGIGLDQITDQSIRVSFTDVSDNETGNRILRTADLLNWEILRDVGPVPKFDTHFFTDDSLTHETQYCYMIETFNAEGARKSQMRCAHTLDTSHIKIWRLQMRVRIANLEDAGADHPLRVIMHTNRGLFSTETFLDYGRDDFERNSDFTYDLNLENIEELSQIGGFQIINHGSDEDYMYVRELELLVNNHPVFSRVFGNANASVLKLGYYGQFSVNYDELRGHELWQSFISQSLSNPTFNLPEIGISDNNLFQAVIKNEEIVSRIESLMGHLMLTDPALKGNFQWGEISGAPVEVTRVTDNKIHVDLDVEAIIGWWPNPEVDIDFDISFTKACDPATNRMTITMQSENFTSNADYPLWKDILSLGTTKLTADVIDWYAENCTTPPVISRSFSVDVPADMDCDALEVKVNAGGDLVICCFSLLE